MADRPRFPGGTFGNRFGDPALDGEVLPPPIDPERFRHIQLLNEAVLVNFAASPNPRTPWGWSTLAWDVTMPTTFLPGVHVEAVLFGEGEQIVPADWIEASLQPSLYEGYGYQWWLEGRVDDALPGDLFMANGFDGQYIYIIPSLGLVVVRF